MIYRDQFSNKLQDLQTSMEDSARKYGSKLFIIDNLMTVDLDATSESMNEKQTEFVQWLIQFAMKYNVATVLVCHPRKLQPVLPMLECTTSAAPPISSTLRTEPLV